MFFIQYFLFAVVGAFAGFVSGLLGIGGGIIAIPALVIIFKILGFPSQIMQIILATSLSAMVLSTASALIAQQRRKNISWNIALKLILGTVVGCVIGAKIAYDIPSDALKILFGSFMCLISAYIYKNSHRTTHPEPKIPSTTTLGFIGFANSALSTLLGISGGLFMVPILQELHFPLKKAIGISSATNFFTALIGSLSFVFLYSSINPLPYSLGPIYLPAFFMIGITTILFAPLGVKLSHELHSHRLQKIFAFVMFFAGLYMLFVKA